MGETMTYNELQPQKLFSYFKIISDIPRSSGNEADISMYVYNTAMSLGHDAHIDSYGNVLVTAKATEGYEDHPPIMLQAHLDMVCEANQDTTHDFNVDPLELVIKGDWLKANGTTLGADDGIGVAAMLAILDSNIPHPPLECLFTVEEEVGMGGITKFDASTITSRRLINLDAVGDATVTASCAGSVRSYIFFEYEKIPSPNNLTYLSIKVKGLFGGHSGEDAHRGRSGAVSIMSHLLSCGNNVSRIFIADLKGGNRENAIPRECSALIGVSEPDKFMKAIFEEEEKIRQLLVPDDYGMNISVSIIENIPFVLSDKDSTRLISMISILPTGVQSMSHSIKGLVEASVNLASIKCQKNEYVIAIHSRSSCNEKLDELIQKIDISAHKHACKVDHINRYPGWSFEKDTPLQMLYLSLCKKIYGVDGTVTGIHAGLECGVIKEKIPDMDIIAIGPEIHNLHSPDEKLSISSFAKLYNMLCEILKNA